MNLRWNTSEYGGVKDLRIPPHRIWKPDVLMYNSADEGFDGTYQTNVVVRNNGSCLYVPPGIFKSTCKIDITWFPFDDQRCEMKFGSWTYDGFQVFNWSFACFPVNVFSQCQFFYEVSISRAIFLMPKLVLADVFGINKIFCIVVTLMFLPFHKPI